MLATLRALLGTAVLFVTLPAIAEPITATLRLKERVTMEELAHNVQNPLSDHYGRFYEPFEIRQLAGPTDNEYFDLLTGLKAEGLQVVNESPTHLWVSVRGEKAIYEALFATQIQSFRGGQHRAMAVAQVPVHLSLVQSVTGLDNTRKSHPHLVRLANSRSFTPGGISSATIKTTYGFDPIYKSGLTGKGQHIAIATYNGFNLDNVNQYFTLLDLKPAPQVDLISFNGSAPYDEQSAGETELDAEFSGTLAPNATIHVFASATNDDNGELQMFTAILDDNRAKIANYSWGGCEASVTPQHKADMEKVFARAVAQGVNIFVASGDSGSDSCQTGSAAADWPAASPYVVAVGGTTLSASSSLSETAWSGSGGGISAVWSLPSWQQPLGSPYLKRSYPDVAFNADPSSGQAIYTGAPGSGAWVVVGGTSMASPQWAGFMALVGEARQKRGASDLGFLNPIIYALNVDDRAALFNDVTTGSNGAYSAALGWDAVTGFGSMQASNLLSYLQVR